MLFLKIFSSLTLTVRETGGGKGVKHHFLDCLSLENVKHILLKSISWEGVLGNIE